MSCWRVKRQWKGTAVSLYSAVEGEQTRLDGGEVGEVVGREHLALHDGEVDLDLVEPGGMGRQMDEDQVGVAAPGGASTAVAPRWLLPLSTIQKTRGAER